MSESRLAWSKIRVLSSIASAGLILLLITFVLAVGVLPALRGSPPGLPEALEVGAVFLLQLVIGYFLGRARCPNCQGAFFRDPMSAYVVHPLTTVCQLCGIAKYADLPAEKN